MDERDESERSLLDPGLIGQVLRQLEHAEIEELDVADGSSRLYVRRLGLRLSARPDSSDDAADSPAPGVPVVAPLTGVYYSRPAPDEPRFVEVGSEIHVDDIVALIETMKLFNEVKAEVAGRVTHLVPTDGDLVEAGTPLMFVEPAGEEV